MAITENICAPILKGSTGSTFPQSFGLLGLDWMTLSLLAMLVSILILVLAYMFSQLLRNPKLTTWCKFEIFQILATCLLALFVMYVVVEACQFNMGFLSDRYIQDKATGKGYSMYQIIDNYFLKLEKLGATLFSYMMYVANKIGFLSRMLWISNPMSSGMSDTPLESLGQLNSIMFFMVGGFFTAFLMLFVQLLVLQYTTISILFYLFPFGVFFRSFEPTRKFGGMLMGISMAFLLFYPILLVVNDFIVYGPINEAAAELDGAAKAANNDMKTAQTAASTGADSSSPVSKDPQADLENFGEGVAKGIFFLLRPVVLFFVAAVVLQALNFMILIEITRALTATFGEEIDVSNLTRMI